MKHTLISLIFIGVASLLIGCKGDQGPVGPQGPAGPGGSDGQQGEQGLPGISDKQIRIEFDNILMTGARDTTWHVLNSNVNLLDFNKNNYVGVDSIIFYANIGSTSPNTNCIVELLNLTDNAPIPGSTLTTNDTTKFYQRSYGGVWVRSSNIASSFPNKAIDLTMRLKSSIQGSDVYLNGGILLLYRK